MALLWALGWKLQWLKAAHSQRPLAALSVDCLPAIAHSLEGPMPGTEPQSDLTGLRGGFEISCTMWVPLVKTQRASGSRVSSGVERPLPRPEERWFNVVGVPAVVVRVPLWLTSSLRHDVSPVGGLG